MNVQKKDMSANRSAIIVLDLMHVAATLAIVWMEMDYHAMVRLIWLSDYVTNNSRNNCNIFTGRYQRV